MISRLALVLVAASLMISYDTANGQLLRRNRNRNNCNNCCQNCNNNSQNYQSATETVVSNEPQSGRVVESSNVVQSSEVVQASYAPEVEASYPTQTAVTEQSYPVVENPVEYAPTFEAPPQPLLEPIAAQPQFVQPPFKFAPNQLAPNQMQNYPQSYPGQVGFRPHDVGYIGPGNMRTHLWVEHSGDLARVGIDYNQVMAMPLDVAQQWHNHFHGTEGPPSQTAGQGTFATTVSYQQNF